jgi:hypothetical protein
LYVAELSLVEAHSVETGMVDLAKALQLPVAEFTPAQQAAFDLAHQLRDSLQRTYGFDETLVDNLGDVPRPRPPGDSR